LRPTKISEEKNLARILSCHFLSCSGEINIDNKLCQADSRLLFEQSMKARGKSGLHREVMPVNGWRGLRVKF